MLEETIIPLCNFDMDVDELRISNEMKIVRLSEEEIIKILDLNIDLSDVLRQQDYIFRINQFALKYTKKHLKTFGETDGSKAPEKEAPENIQETMNGFLKCLHIFQDGSFYPISTIKITDSIFNSGIQYRQTASALPYSRGQYRLLVSDHENLMSLWGKFNKEPFKKAKYLDVALIRYGQAKERSNDEDAIIDLMIAAEAIFLGSSGDSNGELKYRLAHRAAMLLGNTPDEKQKIFTFMKKAYDTRSSIVHGVKPRLPNKEDGTKHTLNTYSSEIEKYLRQALNKIIAHICKHNEIQWDLIIFDLPPS